MQQKALFFLIFTLTFAQMYGYDIPKFPKLPNINIAVSGSSVSITLPNGSTISMPLTFVKEVIQNISINKTFSNSQVILNREIERVKEIYKYYGGNESEIDKEFQEELFKNLSISPNASQQEIMERIMIREKEVLEKIEKKFINASAQQYWKHRFCIMIYPTPKECIPKVFPIFLNETIKIMLPNGSIISLNKTIVIKGLGEVRLRNISKNETEIEVENETSHSFIREIKNRPVIVTITKTANATHVMITNLISGVKNEISVEKEDGVFKHVVIHTKENVSNIVVNITRIKNITLPPQMSEKLKERFQKSLIYRIATNVSNSKLMNVTITFRINQSWLDQVNSSIDKVVIARMSEKNGSSTLLPITNITSEKVGNETFYNLTAVSPGFSYFIVFPPTVPITPPSSSQLPSPEQIQAQANWALLLVAAVALIIVILTAFVIRKKSKKK